MGKSVESLVFAIALFALATQARAADDYKSVSLNDSGDLEIRVPASWQQSDSSRQGMRTIEFSPASGPAWKVLVTAGHAGANRSAREIVEHASREAGPQSVEGTLALRKLCPTSESGYYFSATDKAPKPGEFRFMMQGAVQSGEWALIFTVLSNGHTGQPEENSLRAFRELACKAAPPAAIAPSESNAGKVRMAFPGAGWSLYLDLDGFEPQLHQRDKAGRMERIQASNHSLGVTLSAFVLKEPGTQTAESCRELYWPSAVKSPIEKTEVRRSQYGEMAIGEYTITFPDGTLDRHMNAYLGREGGCVDVHLSRISHGDDRKAFFDVLRSRVAVR